MSSFSASARRAMATAYGSLLAQAIAQDSLPMPHDPAPACRQARSRKRVSI
ncbi:hypothetical protein [Paenirhodobacter populi]|uniref:hypothetical protein n=1 Tax=Paenirhodobacter populi TaxID=2306993 RepID=UPI0013E3CA1C|nr:hypothetical protein [Sinirhodobacter populi]